MLTKVQAFTQFHHMKKFGQQFIKLESVNTPVIQLIVNFNRNYKSKYTRFMT